MVVHTYDTSAGGYMYSFGLGREAAKLVNDYVYELAT